MPITRRPRAQRDLEQAAFFYRDRGGAGLGRRFVRAIIEREDRIDVLRILHAQRDVEAEMNEAGHYFN